MSQNSRTDHFFIYGKNDDNSYNGITYCVVLMDGRMYHGEARCSKLDQFVKNEGRILAYERAQREYEKDCLHRGVEALDYTNPYIKDEGNE